MASWTFDACAASSGAEGLQVLLAAAHQGISVDCIVLDYQMPGMTGGEMARIVRATPEVADTPIVHADLGRPVADRIELPRTFDRRATDQAGALFRSARNDRRRDPESAAPTNDRRSRGYRPAGHRHSARRGMDAEAAHGVGARAGGGHRIDILVAEDNEVNQLVFTQILGETGYSFQIVGNGRLALKAFAETNPRIILMDVSMPEMSGLEATAAIRDAEDGADHHVPIIGVTAHALKGDRERCLEAGMDDYLSKPISPKALIDKVERWISQSGQKSRHAG